MGIFECQKEILVLALENCKKAFERELQQSDSVARENTKTAHLIVK